MKTKTVELEYSRKFFSTHNDAEEGQIKFTTSRLLIFHFSSRLIFATEMN